MDLNIDIDILIVMSLLTNYNTQQESNLGV